MADALRLAAALDEHSTFALIGTVFGAILGLVVTWLVVRSGAYHGSRDALEEYERRAARLARQDGAPGEPAHVPAVDRQLQVMRLVLGAFLAVMAYLIASRI